MGWMNVYNVLQISLLSLRIGIGAKDNNVWVAIFFMHLGILKCVKSLDFYSAIVGFSHSSECFKEDQAPSKSVIDALVVGLTGCHPRPQRRLGLCQLERLQADRRRVSSKWEENRVRADCSKPVPKSVGVGIQRMTPLECNSWITQTLLKIHESHRDRKAWPFICFPRAPSKSTKANGKASRLASSDWKNLPCSKSSQAEVSPQNGQCQLKSISIRQKWGIRDTPRFNAMTHPISGAHDFSVL